MPSPSSSALLKWLAPLSLLALSSNHHALLVFAFDFTYSPPTQCDPLNVSWTGGRAPFYLLVTPLFNPSQNLSIPAASFDAATQDGSFSTQLNLPAGQRFLLTMSDADGFGSGGVSNLLTTGSSPTGASCNTTSSSPPFTFQTPNSLQQCGNFLFTGYNGSTLPDTIRGLIPLGQTFSLTTSPGSDSFTWQTNVAAETSIVFIMTDSDGQSGGTSDLLTVSTSGDASCLDGSSPHSTASASSQTSAPHETQAVQAASSGIQPGEIAGIVLGSIALLLLAIILAIFLMRRRKKHEEVDKDDDRPQLVQVGGGVSTSSSRLSRMRTSIVPNSRRRTQHSVDLITPGTTHPPSPPHRPPPFPMTSSHSLPPGNDYDAQPYEFPSAASAMDGHSSARDTHTDAYGHVSHSSPRQHSPQNSRSSHYHSQSDDANSPTSYLPNPHINSRRPSVYQSYLSSPTSPKGSSRTSAPRFILHTDAEDPDGELLELPPEYNERRARPPAFPSDTKQAPSS